MTHYDNDERVTSSLSRHDREALVMLAVVALGLLAAVLMVVVPIIGAHVSHR